MKTTVMRGRAAALGMMAAAVVTASAAIAAPHIDAPVPFAGYRDHGGVVVQEDGNRSENPGEGAVEAYQDHGAIRLVFRPDSASSDFRTDVFARVDGRPAAPVLGPPVATNLDVRGVYRAELRDASGAPVGWLRVSVSPFDVHPRVYDGAVPAAVGPQLVTAALERLDAELDWIEAHATDVYLGN